MSNFLRKILIEKRWVIRMLFFLFFDGLFVFLSISLAFLLRFEGTVPPEYFPTILGTTILALVITLPIFYFSKLYSFTWIYVSAGELISLAKAAFLSSLLLAGSIFLLRDNTIFDSFPRSTLFISYFLIFIFSGGARFTKRIYLQSVLGRQRTAKERTLIVGAGDAGEQILRSILASKLNPYLPVGFVDDSLAKQGILIHGVKVLGRVEDIPKIAKDKRAEGLIVALPSAGSQAIRGAVGQGRKAGLKKIKIVPPIEEVISGQVGLGSLREVEMEELLGRDPVSLDQGAIDEFIKNKTVLVTGAAGSIGSELCRQIVKFNPQRLLLLDQDETGVFNIFEELKNKFGNITAFVADVRDQEKIGNVFRATSPNIVFHAAAYKHVPLMEKYPDEAVKNNVLGTEVLVKIASGYGSLEKFIMISTDKAVNPSSVMGATKRLGEIICQAADKPGSARFISVRFGNVLGSRGSVIPLFKEKIRRRESIEITHPEMQRYFMTTPEACLLVMQAGAMGQGGEVFVLDMGNPIKIVDLAKELIKLSGLEPDKDIPIVFTEPRPGEKFFEELLTVEEGTVATGNQKIFKAKLAAVDSAKLARLDELKKSAIMEDRERIMEILKEIIPNYEPGR